LLTGVAFFAVGWPKKLDLFKLSLLIVASVVAFRTQRDAWFLGICAAVSIADILGLGFRKDATRESAVGASALGKCKPTPLLTFPEFAGVGVVLAIMMWLTARNTGFTTRDLDRAISQEYPVNAVNFVRQNSFSGPLYNNLDWGGFLIWYLPQYPVVVDGRNDLYGDELDLLTYNSAQGESYISDPYLNEAGLVLLPKKLPLANLLTIDSRFRLIYQDPISVVFARK